MVKWAKDNVAQYGGDPTRIYLMGQSAGSTHVATYVFDRSLQPPEGPGIEGAILISGRYKVEYDPADPNGANMQAYFGTDPPSLRVSFIDQPHSRKYENANLPGYQ
jgi:carboxylesterase type B